MESAESPSCRPPAGFPPFPQARRRLPKGAPQSAHSNPRPPTRPKSFPYLLLWPSSDPHLLKESHNVSLSRLAAVAVPLPPPAEQEEIVAEVQRRLSAADRLASNLDNQVARAQSARRQLLNKAFAGALLPQDPQDEDASVLLERIRSARVPRTRRNDRRRDITRIEMKARHGHRNLLAVLRENGKPMTPEELFLASGHSQDSVDEFFAELRELTAVPPTVVEERGELARPLLQLVKVRA